MKTPFILFFALALGIVSCQKKIDALKEDMLNGNQPPTPANVFVQYTILAGQQYSNLSAYTAVQYDKLSFVVKFDSSAIYQTIDPANQDDINKLYGFSDNNAQHHEFSARFGWRWSNNALRLFAYVYNNGQLSSRELGTIAIGAENDCSIRVNGNEYLFDLNGATISMPRASTTARAEGYKLFPYFGGNEIAPHTINIWIREK